MLRILKISFLLIIVGFSMNVLAKSSSIEYEYPGVVAYVDGEIILEKDVIDKLQIMKVSMGIESSDMLEKEALNELILSCIKWHHIQKFAPKGGWTNKKEIDEIFSNMALRNNMNVNAFTKWLEDKNVNVEQLKKNIKINLSWNHYIEAKFGRNINISQYELKRTLEDIKSKKKMESFYVYRMFFPLTNKKSEQIILSKVNSIKQILDKGGKFEELAQQFSQGPDAKKGGDLGWVFSGQISAEEFSALNEMTVGEYKIVKNNQGYYILYLKDKKVAGHDYITTIKFIHIAVPRPEYANGQDTRALLNELKISFPSQSQFINQAKVIGCYVSEPIVATLELMRPDIREKLSKCEQGQVSDIISDKQALFVFCVLKKDIKKIPDPTISDIRNQKINERLGIFSSREIQELQERAHIEYVNNKNLIAR